MDETLRNQLEQAGIDVAGALERFMGNTNMLVKFLKKFPVDPNFGKLEDAVAQEDKEGAMAASHTLKGVCGNLSIMALHGLVAKQVELLRADQWEEAVGIMPEIRAEYAKVNDTLLKCLP